MIAQTALAKGNSLALRLFRRSPATEEEAKKTEEARAAALKKFAEPQEKRAEGGEGAKGDKREKTEKLAPPEAGKEEPKKGAEGERRKSAVEKAITEVSNERPVQPTLGIDEPTGLEGK